MLKLLLAAGADKEARDVDGCTPLHLAAQRETPDCADALIQAGADVHSRNSHSRATALHFAASHRRLPCVRLFVKSGIDIDAMDRHGNTAIHITYISGYVGVATLLASLGADPAPRDASSVIPQPVAEAAMKRLADLQPGAVIGEDAPASVLALARAQKAAKRIGAELTRLGDPVVRIPPIREQWGQSELLAILAIGRSVTLKDDLTEARVALANAEDAVEADRERQQRIVDKLILRR